MISRKLILILLAALALPTMAQITIDGRHVCYDEASGLLLATIPEAMMKTNQTLTILPEAGWKDVFSDGKSILGPYLFKEITADKSYYVTLFHSDGSQIEARIMFTFLPTMQLIGSFSNDYSPATFIVSDPSQPFSEHLTAQIKWRGGSTNAPNKHKRNYKIKLSGDHSFFGLRNDNNWILDAGQADVFRFRNKVAMEVWNAMATKPYYADREPRAMNGISGRMVEVFLGDEWRGAYNFTECIDRKQLRVKKVTAGGGVRGCLYKAIGWYSCNMYDTLGVYDNHSETWYNWEVKYPELSDNDSTDWYTLSEAINFVAASSNNMFKRHISKFFDLPVVIDYCVFGSTLGASDNAGKNMYWACYDKTADRMLTPTPWDLDCTVGQRWSEVIQPDFADPEKLSDMDFNLVARLLYLNVDSFRERLNQRFIALRQTVLSTDSLISRYADVFRILKNSGAMGREVMKWSGDSDLRGEQIDFQRELDYITNWLTRHLDAMDAHLFPMVDGITTPTLDPAPPRQGTYTLNGQRIKEGQTLRPGLYIRDGKKIVVR